MSDIKISSALDDNYKDYYEGKSEWRRLGAVDKAKNIVSSCKACPHDVILDIGAGEGSVIQELVSSNFGKEYYAFEISESDVEAIRK
ncbi:MAG: hypothetical protein K8S14_10000 [Actinomycetia bacterium]|nr:hypothetical protein [Actinomycetes bacterium]